LASARGASIGRRKALANGSAKPYGFDYCTMVLAAMAIA
jgi:hypothetical protein